MRGGERTWKGEREDGRGRGAAVLGVVVARGRERGGKGGGVWTTLEEVRREGSRIVTLDPSLEH